VEEGRIGKSTGFCDGFYALVRGAEKNAGALDAAALQKADRVRPGDALEYLTELHFAQVDSFGQVGDSKVWVSEIFLDAFKHREHPWELRQGGSPGVYLEPRPFGAKNTQQDRGHFGIHDGAPAGRFNGKLPRQQLRVDTVKSIGACAYVGGRAQHGEHIDGAENMSVKMDGNQVRVYLLILPHKVLHTLGNQHRVSGAIVESVAARACPSPAASPFEPKPHGIVNDPRTNLPTFPPLPLDGRDGFDAHRADPLLQLRRIHSANCREWAEGLRIADQVSDRVG